MASLEEYVLVNTKKARIECYRRTEDNLWLLQFYTLNDQNFKLTSIEFQGNIIDVYEQVELSKN